jgi:hypothetical protein
MNAFILQVFLFLALVVIPVQSAGFQTNCIEGWTALVDEKLLAEDKAGTHRALELLRTQLQEIVRVAPPAAVVKLREVTLFFSPEYPGVRPTAEYHPDARWLREHHRNEAMARGIEFTNVRIFDAESKRMPNFALHELHMLIITAFSQAAMTTPRSKRHTSAPKRADGTTGSSARLEMPARTRTNAPMPCPARWNTLPKRPRRFSRATIFSLSTAQN